MAKFFTSNGINILPYGFGVIEPWKGLNKLKPLETNQTKYLQDETSDGNWAYPGTDE